MRKIIIPAPEVPFPGGQSDADFMRGAAWKLENGYPVGGSNVTRTIVKLLKDVARALDSTALFEEPKVAWQEGYDAGLEDGKDWDHPQFVGGTENPYSEEHPLFGEMNKTRPE